MNKAWLLLNKVTQVKALQQDADFACGRLLPLTEDMATAAELERLGIPFVDLWTLLTGAEVDANSDKAFGLAASWWDEDVAGTVVGGTCLAKAGAYGWVPALQVCLNASLVWKKLLTQCPPSRVIMHELPRVAVFNFLPAPIFDAAGSLSQSVLRWHIENMGMDLELRSPLLPPNKSLGRWKQMRLPVLDMPSQWRSGTGHEKLAIIVQEGLDRREIPALMRALHASGRWRPSLLSTEVLRHCGQRPAVPEIGRARLACRRQIDKYLGPYPEIFGNRHLGFQFERAWDEIEGVAAALPLFGAILDRFRPEIVVFGHESFALSRAMEDQCRRRGIASAGLLHSGYGHQFLERGNQGAADGLMAWNARDCQSAQICGVRADRLQVVGSLRYDLSSRLQDSSVSGTTQVRRRLKLPEGPVVVLLTSAIHCGMANPIALPVGHRATWSALLELAERRPDVTFLIKPHPSYDHYDYYHWLCRLGPANFRLCEWATMDQLLRVADAAVMVNYTTTAGLEAALNGVPVIWLRTALWPGSGRDSLMPPEAAVIAESVEVMADLVQSWLADRRRRDAVLSEQYRAACWYVGRSQQPVAERVVEALKQVKKPDAIEAILEWIDNEAREAANWLALGIVSSSLDGFFAALRMMSRRCRGRGIGMRRRRALLTSALNAALCQQLGAGDLRNTRKWAMRILWTHPWICFRAPELRRSIAKSFPSGRSALIWVTKIVEFIPGRG